MTNKSEDAFVGRTVRLILIPLMAVLVPLLLYVSATVHSLEGQMAESGELIAAMHADMRGTDRRVTAVEDDMVTCRDRLRECEVAWTRLEGLFGAHIQGHD